MLKKTIPIILIFIFTFIPISLGYTDIEDYWANESIDKLSGIGIIQGYKDGTFKPNGDMTRAELITVVNRLLKNENRSLKYIPDNDSKSWYYDEIRKAVQSGLILGDEEGNVYPNNKITREEAVVILARAFAVTGATTQIDNYADSSEISSWSKDSMSAFVNAGYIKGYEDNTIKPKGNITRAEIITILTRMFNEILISGEYTKTINGNLLVCGEDTGLKGIIVNGNVIITEGTKGKVVIDNIIVEGDLILRTPVELGKKSANVKGEILRLYEIVDVPDSTMYKNDLYGIEFSMPDNATIIDLANNEKDINYKISNLITINIEKSEENHFISFTSKVKTELRKYANIYTTLEEGKIGTSKYGIYTDKENSQVVIIKRDDIFYTLFFYNIDNINIVDNIVRSLRLTDGTNVEPHNELIYKNLTLSLKFRYMDYMGVDDSYNTKIVFDGDTYFMLFIQVNKITDLNKYSLNEIRQMLTSLVKEEGKIVKTEMVKINKYDAIKFITESDEKTTISAYIIVENMLYKLAFIGDTEKINSIGGELFEDVLTSVEI